MAFQAQGREHQLFAIRVCFCFHPTASSRFRALLAPIPCLLRFHPSPPARVCGFSERGRGSGASAASMADAAPALTAPWPAAGGALAGAPGAEPPTLRGTQPAPRLEGFALLWGDGRARLGVLEAKRRRAEATLVPAGMVQSRRRDAEDGPSRGDGGAAPAPAPSAGDAASHKHEPGSRPRPPQPAPLTGQTDRRMRHRLPRCLQGLAGPQPGGRRSRGGKVTLAAPGWPRVPVGGLCPGCRTRLCRSLLLAAACCLANAAEHRTAPHRCRHVPARCWSPSRGWGGPGPP